MEVKYTKTPTKKTRKKKKAKKVCLILLALMMVAIICVVLLNTLLFPIENISIENAENTIYTAEEILNASGVNKGDKLFGVKETKINRILTEKLPYLKEVKITRNFPSSITISVLPETAKFSINLNGKYTVISEDYKALEKTVEHKENTIKVFGVQIENAEIGDYVNFKDENMKDVFLQIIDYTSKYEIAITGLDLSVQTQLKVVINDTITANLGSITDIEYKAQYLKSMLKNINQNERGIIDLSNWSTSNPKGYYAKEENQ